MIKRRLTDPARDRSRRLNLLRTEPAIGARDLRRRYPAIITIQKSTFRLRLFRNLRYDRSYSVAVGQPAYPTPEGLFLRDARGRYTFELRMQAERWSPGAAPEPSGDPS